MESHKESYNHFVGGLVKQTNADYILEIGLGTGLTANVCLDYLSQRNKGKYVVLDFAPRAEGLDVLSKYDKKFWELRVGDTSKDDGIFQNLHDTRADVVLIDGAHLFNSPIIDTQKVILNGCAKDSTIFVYHDVTGSHLRQSCVEISRIFKMDMFPINQANLTLGQFSNRINF